MSEEEGTDRCIKKVEGGVRGLERKREIERKGEK